MGNEKVIGITRDMIANDKIKWESTAVTDFGFDASFWKGRIAVTFDWFNKTTSDILLTVPVPYTYLGNLNPPYQNAGKVSNKGWELAVNYNDHHS